MATASRKNPQESSAVLEIATGKIAKSIQIGFVDCTALAITPDGKTIVMGDKEGGVHLWDAESERSHFASTGGSPPVTSRRPPFQPTAVRFATGGAGPSILVWRMPVASKDTK